MFRKLIHGKYIIPDIWSTSILGAVISLRIQYSILPYLHAKQPTGKCLTQVEKCQFEEYSTDLHIPLLPINHKSQS